MEHPTFNTVVTHSLTDDTGKVWVKSETSWQNSSYAEAVALQALMVDALGKTVALGWSIVEEHGGSDGKAFRKLVRKVIEKDGDGD